MIRNAWLIAYCLLITVAGFAQPYLKPGAWHATLQLNDSTVLPFQFEKKERPLEIINAEERIEVTDIKYAGDSIFIQMPVFDSEIRCRMKNDSLIGNFLNHARTTLNTIPFKAAYGEYKPMVNEFEVKDFAGRWEVVFAGDDPPLNISVGIFNQKGNHLTGTFLTSTGDYRYLEGWTDGNKMYLSCYDGSHLFYFNAAMNDDGTLSGHYYSGRHWHDTWTAKRNEKVMLPDEYSLTYLKNQNEPFDFTFPDDDSVLVSLSDPKFRNKVVVVQLMGSWCPNCMDETAFLAPFYRRHRDEGLEIIGIDYEKIPKLHTARHNLDRLKKQFRIEYTLLFGGSSDKAKRVKTLPQLNDIIALPTTIYMDRKGNVRKIHTGFSGPATGEPFLKWKEDFEKFIAELLAER